MMVAPQVVGTATTFASTTSGATVILDKPSGVQTGDLLVAVLRTNGSTSPTDFVLSGWTRRGYTFKASDGAGRVTGVFTHPVTDASTEPASYTFTKSVSDARRVGAMFVVRGVDLSNPVAGNSVNWDATSAPRVQLNSFTVDTTDAALLVYAWGVEIVSPNATAPTITPSTAVALVPSSAGTGATRTTLWAGAETISGGASTGAKNLTWSSSTGEAATGFVLRGLSTPVAPKTGFSSVTHMLATPGATWAHRGGSVNWPEMSEYAYDQAVAAGYGALEFSANRTSDGVWVGVHDASLNRTSQTSGLPDISTMTWAQVQTYQNSLNSAGTPRPYYRLDAFLDKYTPTHVVIVDPKYAIGAYNTEFLNLLDAHGGPSKIVVKFYGAGSGAVALADAAAARGYQTWGYFYDTDVTSGELAAWQSHWSILGMNYDAPQSAWDAVLAYGKPVVGHIAGSQANYDTAISRGARMVQCSNVAGITAVGASSIAAVGSLSLSGSASRTVDVARTAVGALTLTGSASASVNVARSAVGTLNLDGTAPRTIDTTRDALGELTIDGTASRTANVTRTAAGSLELTGMGLLDSGGVARTATGVLNLTGTATRTIDTSRSAAGELVITGTATRTVSIERAAVGSLVLSGVGVLDHEPVVLPDRLTLTEVTVSHTLAEVSVKRTLEEA